MQEESQKAHSEGTECTKEKVSYDVAYYVEMLFHRGLKSFFECGVIPYDELLLLLKLKLINDGLLKHNDNIAATAKFLHMRRSTLAEFMRSYSIVFNQHCSIAENFRLSINNIKGRSIQEYKDLVARKRLFNKKRHDKNKSERLSKWSQEKGHKNVTIPQRISRELSTNLEDK